MINLNFELDFNSKIKLFHQIYNKIKSLIDSNELTVNTKLPSIRTFSAHLKCSKNTVTKAYIMLEEANYIYSKEKSGYYTTSPELSKSIPNQKLQEDSNIPTVDSILGEIKQSNYIKTTIVTEDSFSNYAMNDNKLTVNNLKNNTKSVPILLNSGEIIDSDKDAKLKSVPVKSPEEVLLKSFTDTLINKKHKLLLSQEPFGQENFRVAISTFLYKFYNIDVSPSSIIVSSNYRNLLRNVISLPSLKYVSENKNKGLLKLAELSKLNRKNNIAMLKSTDNKIKNVFNASHYEINDSFQDSLFITNDSMLNNDNRIIYTVNINKMSFDEEKFLDYKDKIFNWLENSNDRYVIEYEKTTIPYNNSSLKKYDTENKIIYFSSFSNLISSYMKISFVILPDNLLNEYKEMYKFYGCSVSLLEQQVLTDFVISGKLQSYLENLESI